MEKFATFIVIGGGIAGVTCVEQLSRLVHCEESIILLTASSLVKSVSNIHLLTRNLEEFDVEEKTLSEFSASLPANVQVVHDAVTNLNTGEHKVYTSSGSIYRYRKLCLCAGGRPKVISGDSKYVLGIRDTETVKEFKAHLSGARRIVIIGNGGIATEIAYEVTGCQVIWAVKDRSIGATFFDAGAAEFFRPQLSAERKRADPRHPLKRHKYGVQGSTGNASSSSSHETEPVQKRISGVALGPDWSSGLLTGDMATSSQDVIVEYGTEVAAVLTAQEFKLDGPKMADDANSTSSDGDWKVYVQLTNGKIYGCDFLISATGVIPNADIICDPNVIILADDGGIKVNEFMETSVRDVYAAGDICTAGWVHAPHWFQMRLWTQAKQMGAYVAKCMAAHLVNGTVLQDFCFEIFTHVTRFFGFKVILLGLYNAQGLGTDYEILLRTTKEIEYVKVVMQNGRMRGAVLVGETDLEETFENLILNQMDLSVYGADLLNPDVDVEDYFD